MALGHDFIHIITPNSIIIHNNIYLENDELDELDSSIIKSSTKSSTESESSCAIANVNVPKEMIVSTDLLVNSKKDDGSDDSTLSKSNKCLKSGIYVNALIIQFSILCNS